MNYFVEQYLIDIIYGLVFFLIGYSIIIVQPARITNCTLSKHLRLLAMFGILHGLGEWTRPIANLTGHAYIKPLADTLAPILISTSFIFLVFFGVSLLSDFIPSRIISKGIPYLLIIVWIGAVITSLNGGSSIFWSAKAWSRYILGFPGALLTSLAFFFQYLEIRKGNSIKHPLPQNYKTVIGFCLVFFFYGLFALVGKLNPVSPFSLLSSDNFTSYTGIPVELVRTFFGGAILVITLKTLNTFYVVHSNKLQSILKQQTMSEAKSKISQDLHDVTIQSIYATGLRLKYLKRKLKDSDAEIESQIDYCTNNLNKTIKHLRFYITALEYPDFYRDGLKNTIKEIMEEFKNNNDIICKFSIEGTANQEFPLVHLHQIVQITQEALTNISKHAEATEVVVKLLFNKDAVEISIIDNGIGFVTANDKDNRETLPLREEKSFGLKNIEERARNIEAEVTVFSQIGLGTKIHLKVPYGGDSDGKNKAVNS